MKQVDKPEDASKNESAEMMRGEATAGKEATRGQKKKKKKPPTNHMT
jgi:hypothetical protein